MLLVLSPGDLHIRTDSESLRAGTRDLRSNCLQDGVMAPCVRMYVSALVQALVRTQVQDVH